MASRFTTLRRRGLRRIIASCGIGSSPALCENIVGWALVRDWECKGIHPPFSVTLKPPVLCIDASPLFKKWLYANSQLGFAGQYLVTIPEAKVATASGFIAMADGSILCEGKWRVANVIDHPYYRGESIIRRCHQRSGDWLCAMGYFGANYNHWFWDELPRIVNALPHVPVSTQVLIDADSPAFVYESLVAVGVDADRIVRQSFDEESKVERLWFPTPLGHSEWAATSPAVIDKLRTKIWNWTGASPGDRGKRIYVSRANASYRRATNEAELKPLLDRFGFETVYAEHLAWPEQVRRFSHAEVILGIHGAGLTNMLFAPSAAKVCEMHGPMTRLHYWNMGSICGHEYFCICQSRWVDGAASGEPDFALHIAKVTAMCEAAVEQGCSPA